MTRWRFTPASRCCKIEQARFFEGLRTIGLNTGVMTSRLGMRLP